MCSDRHSLQKEQAYSVNTLIFVNTGSFVGHIRLSVAYSGTCYPKISTVMSALGQKRTYAVQKAMSALPPIATAKADFRN
jgi:hypothetical protein